MAFLAAPTEWPRNVRAMISLAQAFVQSPSSSGKPDVFLPAGIPPIPHPQEASRPAGAQERGRNRDRVARLHAVTLSEGLAQIVDAQGPINGPKGERRGKIGGFATPNAEGLVA